jgi:tRNA modification GTPase
VTLADDTITAIATPAGYSGVAVVRVSGDLAKIIIAKYIKNFKARHSYYIKLKDINNELIDDGLMIFFPAPNSYTGEDTLEFYGHGNPVLLKKTINYFIDLGCRLAEAGEFTKRAYLNNKLDLVQAEAVMDIINAQSDFALRAARRNLQGEFSALIKQLEKQILTCRMWVEAAIDFSDQAIDDQGNSYYVKQLNNLYEDILKIIARADNGYKALQTFTMVLIGPPNAGKSSLFNYLCNKDAAIVDSQAGTTRDVLEQQLNINGINCTLLDTAGLRTTSSTVEQQGIERAIAAVESADLIVVLYDASSKTDAKTFWQNNLPCELNENRTLFCWNKVDLVKNFNQDKQLGISVKNEINLEKFKQQILHMLGINNKSLQDMIPAQYRHIKLLQETKEYIEIAKQDIFQLDLLAENLKLAHESLAKIYGDSNYDIVLDQIFSNFCIGK